MCVKFTVLDGKNVLDFTVHGWISWLMGRVKIIKEVLFCEKRIERNINLVMLIIVIAILVNLNNS